MDVPSFLARDRFAAHAGIQLLEHREGFALARMHVGPQQVNAAGVAQGGALFTLADLACAAATNTADGLAVTVDASISFLKPGRGELVAEARTESASARLATVTVRVTDAAGDLVALFKATLYRKPISLDALVAKVDGSE